MNLRRTAFLALIVVAFLQITAESYPAPQPQTHSAKSRNTKQEPSNDGERVFKQNCSRCHNAPEGFPTSISATIVRHMRVRANLSAKDAEAVLRFFNP